MIAPAGPLVISVETRSDTAIDATHTLEWVIVHIAQAMESRCADSPVSDTATAAIIRKGI
ncbi:hypothetical protein SSBR45G_49720 [Bradyrhizobium sp. SSBR45G]|nr:hypothetical protein SSBR45G_49720 [Bradyrhizobium sp. SSBR45G]GLH87628.1 hypothetical protein SSBR45R_50880 [Bradyrhizobium sp. SSBR45R]